VAIPKEIAKRIGRKEAIKFVTVGLGIAYLIMALLAGPLFLFQIGFQINLAIAVVVIYTCGYFYGQLAGVAILIKERNYLWIGLLYSFLTLTTAILISSWTGFFQEGIKNLGTPDNPFVDYIIRPLVVITLFGLIPVIAVGFWFGSSIRKKGRKLLE